MQTMTLALKSLVDQVKQGPALGNSQASSPSRSVKIADVREAAAEAKESLQHRYR